MATVFDVLARFRADVTDYNLGLRSAERHTVNFDAAVQNGGKRAFGMFGMLAGRVTMLGTAVMGLAQTAGMMGIRTAMANEQAAIGFKVMLGSAAKAKEFMDELIEFSAKTPFELPQLRTAASALLSTGVEAKRIIPIMEALGDATAAKGYGAEAIQRSVYALQQMSTAGRATGQDMMQLTQAGVPIWESLAASMNKTIPEIKKLGEQGKISADDVMRAIETYAGAGMTKVKGMMVEQSGTLVGLMSTLKDTINQSLGKMMEPAVESIKSALPGITATFDALLKSIAPVINQTVGTTLSTLVSLLPALEPLVIGFGGLFTSIMAAIAPLIPQVVSALTAFTPVFQSIGEAVREFSAMLMPMVEDVFPAVQAGVQIVADALGGLLGFLTDNKEMVLGLVTAFAAFKAAMLIQAAISTAVTAITALGAAMKSGAFYTWLMNTALYANPIGVVIAAVVALVAAFVVLWMKFEGFRNFWKKVWNGIVDGVEWAVNKIIGYYENLINGVIKGVNLLIKAWNKVSWGEDIDEIEEVNWHLDLSAAKVDIINKKVTETGRKFKTAAEYAKGLYDLNMRFEKTATTPTGGGGGGGGGEGKGNPLQKLIDSINKMASDKVSKAEGYLDQLRQRADSFRDSIKSAMMAVYSFGSALGASRQSIATYEQAVKDVASAEARVNQALASRDMAGYYEAIKEYTAATKALTDAETGKKTFMQALEAQYTQAKDFGVTINRLRAAGLNEAGISQVIAAGAETGIAIGKELLDGGSEAITKANTWYTELLSAANTEADAAKNQFYQQGLSQGEALVKGITDAAKKLNLKLTSKGLSEAQMKKLKKDFSVSVGFSLTSLEELATPMASGGIVRATTGGTLALIGEAGRDEAVIPLPRNGSALGGNTYHITVQTGVGDKQEIGRELVAVLQAHEKRTGRLPIRTL